MIYVAMMCVCILTARKREEEEKLFDLHLYDTLHTQCALISAGCHERVLNINNK